MYFDCEMDSTESWLTGTNSLSGSKTGCDKEDAITFGMKPLTARHWLTMTADAINYKKIQNIYPPLPCNQKCNHRIIVRIPDETFFLLSWPTASFSEYM